MEGNISCNTVYNVLKVHRYLVALQWKLMEGQGIQLV